MLSYLYVVAYYIDLGHKHNVKCINVNYKGCVGFPIIVYPAYWSIQFYKG